MTPEQMKALREPFPPEMVGKLPKGGVELDYVGHGAVTSRLLEVDPEWSWEPLSVDDFGFPRLDSAGNLWIKLTVGGVTRLGVGDGPNMKVLIGDALRNAAMRFGVALDLWIRGHAEDDEKQPQQPARHRPAARNPKAEPLIDRMAVLPEDVQNTLLGWFKVPPADWHTLDDGPLDKLAEQITKAEKKVEASTDLSGSEGGEGATNPPTDPPAPLAASAEDNDTPRPSAEAAAVTKPATNKPSAAARAALEGKPALGSVKRDNSAPDSLGLAQDAFPGAELEAS